MASMPPLEHVTLDRRRGWARIRAALACLVGVLVFALSAAALVMIVVAACARAWSWFTDRSIADAPVWAWAPGGAGALGALAVVVSFVGAFWYFWRGASAQVLHEIHAERLDPRTLPQVANVAEALSIGIGRRPPILFVTNDPAPNALSLRSRRHRILCVTTGCATLPRDELEAMCAHEIGHLWAADAHWVTSGMVAIARARRFGGAIVGIGTLLFVLVIGVAHYADIILWSAGVVAGLLIALGAVAQGTLRRLEMSVRCHADEIADVVAVNLAKSPQSLGALCARLAANPDRVAPVGWRSELMWFEAVETHGSGDVAAANLRSHRELANRAVEAYAEARVPLPPELGLVVHG